MNNLRPVALTSLVMKAMERVIKKHIVMVTDPLMDPLQFAYRAGRGVDDNMSNNFNTYSCTKYIN